jgi:hypothetical protein
VRYRRNARDVAIHPSGSLLAVVADDGTPELVRADGTREALPLDGVDAFPPKDFQCHRWVTFTAHGDLLFGMAAGGVAAIRWIDAKTNRPRCDVRPLVGWNGEREEPLRHFGERPLLAPLPSPRNGFALCPSVGDTTVLLAIVEIRDGALVATDLPLTRALHEGRAVQRVVDVVPTDDALLVIDNDHQWTRLVLAPSPRVQRLDLSMPTASEGLVPAGGATRSGDHVLVPFDAERDDGDFEPAGFVVLDAKTLDPVGWTPAPQRSRAGFLSCAGGLVAKDNGGATTFWRWSPS